MTSKPEVSADLRSDGPLTSADVRLSVGPNLSRAD